MRPLPEKLLNDILTYLTTEDNFVFLETSKISAENRKSLIFLGPTAQLDCRRNDTPEAFWGQAENYLKQGYFLAGWLSYELGYLLEPALQHYLSGTKDNSVLARLGVFRPPLIYDHSTNEFNVQSPFPASPADRQAPISQVDNLRPSMTQEIFLQAIARIKAYIAAGDTYQVNYTLKYFFDFTGSPAQLYKKLRRSQPVAYSAYLKLGGQNILSFSPELFFRKTGTHCQVKPMKGTMARGRSLAEDQALAEFLSTDAKNRSENVMIVDMLRNDLGRLCRMGTVATTSMFDVETFFTLHQMTSTVTGELRPQTSLKELFKALFPCGSVTGAPKIRTMEIINELETGPRGVYTGAIGYIAPNGDAAFNVPIRTVVLQDGRGEMGIGAGITHDSDPEDEWRECLLKGKFLSRPQPDFQLIETILWQPGPGFWLLDHHLARLQDSASYFDYPFAAEDIRRRLAEHADKWHKDHKTTLRVRVLLFRAGDISIKTAPCASPALIDLPTPDTATTSRSELPLITISERRTDSTCNLLFHKTTSRDLYDREREKAVAQGYYEIIFRNERDEITEGAITNIIIKKAGHFYTPALECGLLPGIERARLLERHRTLLSEKTLTQTDLESAEAIYLVNSVRGVTEVRL